MDATALLFLLAFAAGVTLAAQPGVNAILARGVGGPALAALVSFIVGAAALVIFAIIRRSPIPASETLASIPWWAWLGGLLGAFYVTVSIIAAPQIGTGRFFAVVIAGQLFAGVLIDQFGLLGLPQRVLTLPRVLGLALLVAGVVLVRVG